jgi:t-SNARE complex subunit (syntaxin)
MRAHRASGKNQRTSEMQTDTFGARKRKCYIIGFIIFIIIFFVLAYPTMMK